MGHNRILWCDPAGSTIGAVGGPGMADRGTGNYEFNGAFGVSLDGAGNIYVIDTYNNRVQKFDLSGGYLTKWGSHGTGNGQFEFDIFGGGPEGGIAVDTCDLGTYRGVSTIAARPRR